MMRWILVGALFLMLTLGCVHFFWKPSRPPIPTIVSDGVTSDPECIDLLSRLANREPDILEAIRKKEKPVGLKCSNIDIVSAMQSRGAFVSFYQANGRRIYFKLKTKDRWFFGKPSKLGVYEYDVIFVNINDLGMISSIAFDRPYIT